MKIVWEDYANFEGWAGRRAILDAFKERKFLASAGNRTTIVRSSIP